MSVVAPSVAGMDALETAAFVLAASEVAPAEPSDLTALLRDADEWRALTSREASSTRRPLTRYLIETIDPGRIEYWHKLLDRDVHADERYQVVLAGYARYPSRLARTRGAPPLLFIRGTAQDDARPALAIIGSRDADSRSERAAYQVAAEVARAGVDVVSGLARGVDAAAHRGALTAGRTTAVLGTGITQVFPSGHERLAAQICQRGALVSEFPPYAPHTSTTFLRRNGTIAALCDALLVMDASTHSGSRHAVGRATELGRPVLIWAETLQGAPWARELTASGLGRFVHTVNDVHDALGEALE